MAFRAPGLEDKLPARIAVLPFESEAVSLRAPEILREMVWARASRMGYGMPSLGEVDGVLRELGINEGGQLGVLTAVELGAALKVDGLIYGTIEEFVYQNIGVLRRRAVSLRMKLLSGKSGELLWEAVGSDEESKFAVGKEAGQSFLEGVVEQAAEKSFGTPLKKESRKAVRKLFRKFPKSRSRRR